VFVITEDGESECLSMELLLDDMQVAGACDGAPPSDDDPFVAMQEVGPGEAAVFGHVPPEAEGVVFVADDGRRFPAATLHALHTRISVLFFAFRVPVVDGHLEIENDAGEPLGAPIPLSPRA
jgi:hypothetical protein